MRLAATIVTTAVVILLGISGIAYAATNDMSGMSMPSVSTTTSTISPEQLATLNTSAEISDAQALHEASFPNTQAKSLADASTSMSMTAMNPVDLPVSPTLAALTAPIGDLGAGFFWFLTVVLAALFAYCIYLFRTDPRRTRSAKWAVGPLFVLALVSCTCLIVAALDLPYAYQCAADGNAWGNSQPMVAGMTFSNDLTPGCILGMGDFMYFIPEKDQYDHFKEMPPASVTLQQPKSLTTGVPETFTVSLKNTDGSPTTLFVDMNKLLHIVITSQDQTVMAHLHPDDTAPLTPDEIKNSTFTFSYTFPKSGQYMIAFDYSHGATLESKYFIVNVGGGPAQLPAPKIYPSPSTFDGYQVSLTYFAPVAGKVTTLYYQITKNGKPVTFVPWLGAAMHVSVVDNDSSWYLHVHGEVHPPGQPLPAIIVKDGEVIHSMAMMVTPPVFSLPIDAHLIFPKMGTYTVWGQFNTADGQLVTTAFTVRVDQ